MRLLSSLLTVLPTFGFLTLAAPANDHTLATKVVRESRVLRQRSQNVQSPHVITLSRRPSVTGGRSRQAKWLQKEDKGNGTIGLAPLSPYKDLLYYTEITFGAETFNVVVDTGSSDTWLVQNGFQCTSYGRNPTALPEASCRFGPPYTISSTFKQIQAENFNISYLDHETLTGIVGTEQVTLGGITVQNQQVGIVNHAAWNGDNFTSGLVGLAFPNITSAYSGSDPTLDDDSTKVGYNPLFTSMYTQGLVAPVFSLAIQRGDQAGGLLALGGLPPVQHSPYFACTPFQMTTLENVASPVYQYYSIAFDGLTYANHTEKVDYPALVDSGTTLIRLPPETAYAINKLFNPPAYIDGSLGEFVVNCASKPPRFGISIANHTFYVNPKDLIIKNDDGTCITGITEGGYNQPTVLGDVFLKNVLAVFDVGASEMRFAAREFY